MDTFGIDKKDDKKKAGMSTGAVVGIGIGTGAVIGGGLGALIARKHRGRGLLLGGLLIGPLLGGITAGIYAAARK